MSGATSAEAHGHAGANAQDHDSDSDEEDNVAVVKTTTVEARSRLALMLNSLWVFRYLGEEDRANLLSSFTRKTVKKSKHMTKLILFEENAPLEDEPCM